jgi:hypothetical protein
MHPNTPSYRVRSIKIGITELRGDMPDTRSHANEGGPAERVAGELEEVRASGRGNRVGHGRPGLETLAVDFLGRRVGRSRQLGGAQTGEQQ